MRKLAFFGFLFVLVFALCYPVLGAPILSIPDATFDFGYVPQHSRISHAFWLHSTGTDTLKIVKVHPG